MFGSTPVAATALFPWNESFSWTEGSKLSGYSLLLAIVIGGAVTLLAYLVLRGITRRAPVCTHCNRQEQDPAVVRAISIGAVIGLVVILLVPVMYRQGDGVSNSDNASSVALASSQTVSSLEDTIAGQLEFRAASMGYEVIDTDVDSLSTTVQVGTCDVVVDMSTTVPQFVVPQDGGDPTQRFDVTNPFPLLRDARANLDHPLRRCFTADQLDPAA